MNRYFQRRAFQPPPLPTPLTSLHLSHLSRDSFESWDDSALPYPLACAIDHIASLRDYGTRVQAIAWVLECIVRYLTAVALGANLLHPKHTEEIVRVLTTDRTGPRLGQELAGRDRRVKSRLSHGEWRGLLSVLSDNLVSLRTPSDPIVATLVRFRSDEIARAIEDAAHRRNELSHGWPYASEQWESSAEQFRVCLGKVVESLSVLNEGFDLLTMVEPGKKDGSGLQHAKVAVLRGRSPELPTETATLPEDLVPGWCFLLSRSSGELIDLAPIVKAEKCRACDGLWEVFLSDGFVLGNLNTDVKAIGSRHSVGSVRAPAHLSLKTLAEWTRPKPEWER